MLDFYHCKISIIFKGSECKLGFSLTPSIFRIFQQEERLKAKAKRSWITIGRTEADGRELENLRK